MSIWYLISMTAVTVIVEKNSNVLYSDAMIAILNMPHWTVSVPKGIPIAFANVKNGRKPPVIMFFFLGCLMFPFFKGKLIGYKNCLWTCFYKTSSQ